MATNIGRVGMVAKGNWSNSATYEVLDVVSYNGASYIAKQAVPAGTLPTNTTYWQLVASLPAPEETSVTLSSKNAHYSGYLFLRKNGNVVTIYFYDLTTTEADSIIAAIPEAYRPSTYAYRTLLYNYASNTMNIAAAILKPDGNIDFQNLNTGAFYYGTITYAI